MSQKMKGRKDKNDPSRFVGEGVNFRAKLIGIDNVESARGDQMCQESLLKLKAAVKASGEHKQRIVVNVSLEGLTLIDERTKAINHNHAVHRISFISRDVTDPRAFGYIFGVGDGSHKFFAIKTMQAAEFLVLALRDLFQCVYELKKKEMEDAKSQKEGGDTTDSQTPAKEGENIYQVPTNAPVEQKEGENIYQVPSSNEPVTESTEEEGGGLANLVNLEEELQSLEASMTLAEHINSHLENSSPVTVGIEQMNTFEDLFSSTPTSGTGDGGTGKGDPWGAPSTGGDSSGFEDGFGTTTPANNDPFDGAFSTPATTQTSIPSAGGQSSFPSQTTSASFQNSFQAPVTGIPGFTQPPSYEKSFGPGFNSAPTSTVNPLAGVPRPAFGQPTFGAGATPFGAAPMQFGAARTPFGAAQTPFGAAATPFGPGAVTTPFGATPMPTAGGFFGAPPAAANPFGPRPPVPSPSGEMFGGPLLTPITGDDAFATDKDASGPRTAEEDAKPRAGSDLFGDLCEIGPVKHKGKSPKQLFEEEKTVPKKSLSQLKQETIPPPAVPQPVPPQQASDDGNFTSSFSSTSTSSGFSDIPDPFDSFPFQNQSSSSLTEPVPEPLPAANGTDPTTHNRSLPNGHAPSQTFHFSAGVEDFNLPSPMGPPPPLPASRSIAVRSTPPLPPPRPGSDSSLMALPRPQVPRVNGTAPQVNRVNGTAPQVSRVNGISPQLSRNNGTAPQVNRVNGTEPQLPKMNGTMSNNPTKINDSWSSAWQKPSSPERLPRLKGTVSSTNNVKSNDAWTVTKPAVINFAVSDPFNDPFFTDSDSFSSLQTVINSNDHVKTEDIKSLSTNHRHKNPGPQNSSTTISAPDPFGDNFSIFGVPPPSADEPLYATVNKSKLPQMDLL